MATEAGLRERKKERTRQSLHEAALRLFLERGFGRVTVAEIAEEAETAVTTLFKYFPGGKVALVFSQEEDRAAALADAVRNRPAGTDPLTAIEEFIGTRLPFDPHIDAASPLLRLIFETPELRAYARQKWTDCEDALMAVLVEQCGYPDDAPLRALARLILQSPDIVAQHSTPRAALATIFANLRRGWQLDT